jgi:hypothetical protein
MALDVSQELLAAEVAEASTCLLVWRAASRSGAAPQAAPYADLRRIASRATLHALANELATPLQRGLAHHVRYHLLTRLALELEQETDAEYLRKDRVLNLEIRTQVSFRAALAGLLASNHIDRARAHYITLCDANHTLISLQARRRELLAEACSQLALPVWEMAPAPGDRAQLLTACEVFLFQTEALARHHAQQAESALGVEEADRFIACTLHYQTAGMTLEFPARLTARWLHDAVPNLTFRRADPLSRNPRARAMLGRLPQAHSALSFVRTLGALGQAIRWTLPESPVEFARRGDPGGFDPTTHGFVFAGLALSPIFLSRGLRASGVPQDAVREFGRAALRQARMVAARALGVFGGRREELVAQVFGPTTDSGFGSVLLAAHDRAELEAAALFSAHGVTARLRDLFDDDWFRNPRTREYLSGAPPTSELATSDYALAARSLMKQFEEITS